MTVQNKWCRKNGIIKNMEEYYMAYCGHCGKYVKDGTEICPECGCYTIAKSGTKQIASSGANQFASTESKQFAFCDKCGQKIDATATVCSHCGCAV